MKYAGFAFLLACSLSGFSQDTLTKFHAAEALAPAGYPVPFVVESAMVQPATLGQQNGCTMNIATLGKVYSVTAVQMFGECHAFSPGTTIYGKLKQTMAGPSIYLLDNSGEKSKSRQYRIENVELVDSSKQ